jgi:serine/threonine-protein kinase
LEDLEPGLIIDDRYEVRRQLGRGGMSTVYEVEHRYTTRRLALKVLNASYAGHAIARRQLLDEARALGAVRHPYVIEVHDAGFDGSRVYVVTELLDGRPLDGLLAARGRLAWADVARVARHVTIALAASHGVGVLHRDVKPSNVMVVRGVQGEFSKLLDFGVAALPKTAAEAATAGPEMLVGTPEYMAPEQLRGDPVDARSDLYALGITMFECLQGEVPMPGGLDVAHQRASIPSLPTVASVCDDVPDALAAIIDRLLHPVAAFRFPTARALLDTLDASGLCRTPTRFLDDAPPDVVMGRQTLPGERPPPGDDSPRRRAPRAYYQTPIQIVSERRGYVDGRSEDISAGGMMVIASSTLPEGERVTVRFALPTSGNLVQVTAVVGWARHRAQTQRGRAAFGLEFVDPPEAMRAAVERYVELMQREG